MKVALNELDPPYVYLDLRMLEEDYSKIAFYRLLSEAFSATVFRWSKIIDYLKTLKRIEAYGFKIEFNWREESLTLIRILNKLNQFAEKDKERSIIVLSFDEAQVLRNLSGGKGKINFIEILAYAYDNLYNLRFVFTGSEVGLLMNTLKLDNASSPLYGRFVKMIKLERFDDKKSLNFLIKGFEEFNMRVGEEILYKIYEKVDGIVEWSTYFGCSIVESRKPNVEALNQTTEKALKLVEEEFDKVLKRPKYYAYVLKAISLGIDTWLGIKKALKAWLSRPLQNAQISRFLKTLLDLSILEKKNKHYVISDSLVVEYSKKL